MLKWFRRSRTVPPIERPLGAVHRLFEAAYQQGVGEREQELARADQDTIARSIQADALLDQLDREEADASDREFSEAVAALPNRILEAAKQGRPYVLVGPIETWHGYSHDPSDSKYLEQGLQRAVNCGYPQFELRADPILGGGRAGGDSYSGRQAEARNCHPERWAIRFFDHCQTQGIDISAGYSTEDSGYDHDGDMQWDIEFYYVLELKQFAGTPSMTAR